jgi:hypothetical protein
MGWATPDPGSLIVDPRPLHMTFMELIIAAA